MGSPRSRTQAAGYTWMPQESAETELGFLIVFVNSGPDVPYDLGGWEALRWQLEATLRAGATDTLTGAECGSHAGETHKRFICKHGHTPNF